MTYEPQGDGRIVVYSGRRRVGVIAWRGEEWGYRSTVAHSRNYFYGALELNSIHQKLLSLPTPGINGGAEPDERGDDSGGRGDQAGGATRP